MSKLELQDWFFTGLNFDKYDTKIDKNNFNNTLDSVEISRIKKNEKNDFITIMHEIDAKRIINKEIKVSACLKSKDINGWAGFWFSILIGDNQEIYYYNTEKKPITGTNNWNTYSFIFKICQDADKISFGFLLQGIGFLWLNNFNISVVCRGIPKNNNNETKKLYSETPQNLLFED